MANLWRDIRTGIDTFIENSRRDGRQCFRCRDCRRRSTAEARPNGYSEAQRELILSACDERLRHP